MSASFTWQIDAWAVRGERGWEIRGDLEVEIFGDDKFLGVSLSTVGYQDGEPFRWVSRSTSVADAGDGTGGSVRRYASLVVNTYLNPDPFVAAALALNGHLRGYQLESMDRAGFLSAVNTDPWVREVYEERVVDPISTATLALCRSNDSRKAIKNGSTYWCIPRWTLEGVLAPGSVRKALGYGVLAHDILVIPADHPDLHRVKTGLGPNGRQQPWP